MNPKYTPRETRVVKKLNPGEPGTRRLLDRYGSELVCVRYRRSTDGTQILTTIELIVNARDAESPRARAMPKLRNDEIVHLKINPQETLLQDRLKSFGARWNPTSRTWTTQWLIAKHLHLTHRRIASP